MPHSQPQPRSFAITPWHIALLGACLSSVTTITVPAQTVSETVLHNFASPPHGAIPYAGVIRNAAGDLYGTTTTGGAEDSGTVFRVDTSGHLRVLYSFTGGADGGDPQTGLLGNSSGNLYGATWEGGMGSGVIYKLDPTGHQTVLHSFTGGADGGGPTALVRDAAGNFYSASAGGGVYTWGSVIKLDTAGNLTVLYTFTGGVDGRWPAALIRDVAGNLYGTMNQGGTAGVGVLYKIDTTGHQSVLYSFTGGTDGANPTALLRDSAGNLYGTTTNGGLGWGVIYKLDTTGHQTVLYSFTGGADGGKPVGIIRDSFDNFYGAVEAGASFWGGVFRLDAAGNETVLYGFTGGADGASPQASVIRDPAGNLYGTTSSGGVAGLGVVYKLDVTGIESVLYSFPGAADGNFPEGGVIRDSAGNLYGTTTYGGPTNAGTVFKVDSTGHETVLHAFTGGADGRNPSGGVVRDSAGNLYGTAEYGGDCGQGVVFKVDTAGQFTVLHTFCILDGEAPYGALVRDPAGNLYGVTRGGIGTVYELDTNGDLTTLYSFTGGDGFMPNSLFRDSSGNLYGTTFNGGTFNWGVVFVLTAAGQEMVLYSFTGAADGGNPEAGVIRDTAGNIYSTTTYGGSYRGGTVFKLDPTGNETVLYNFTGFADGLRPQSSLLLDSSGNLYGTTVSGGASGGGVVFEVSTTTGRETVLHNFTGGADGGFPWSNVIRDSAGNLYGTATGGGKHKGGVVFKLKTN